MVAKNGYFIAAFILFCQQYKGAVRSVSLLADTCQTRKASVFIRWQTWTLIITFGALLTAFFSTSASADQCPQDVTASARFCCPLAEPLDGLNVEQGGYGWHSNKNGGGGLCQGLASSNVSAPILSVQDLRETNSLSSLPERIEIGYRQLSGSGLSSVRFLGTPQVSGNSYLIAGEVENGATVVWNTKPFQDMFQRFSRFGFAAHIVEDGIRVYTPLVMTKEGTQIGQRESANLVLRSNQSIAKAKVTLEPLNADTLLATGEAAKELPHKQRRSRLLSVLLRNNLPEAFRISVALCAVGAQICDLSKPAFAFNILWAAQ